MIEEMIKMRKKIKYRIEETRNIRDLPCSIMKELREILHVGPDEKSWREFASLLPNSYALKQSEIESIALVIHSSRSPVDELFLMLGGKDFTVKHLVPVLDKMRIEKILFKLLEFIPLEIIKQPQSEVEIEEDQVLKLSVKANGLPYPRYQWFIGDDEVEGAMQDTLIINNVREEDSGTYCCRLHNSKDPSLVKFTNDCEVIVIPKQNNNYCDDFDDDLKKPNTGNDFHHYIVAHPRSATVCLGDSFTLECSVASNHPVKYIWFHDNHFYIECNNGRLQVDNAKECHNGVYYCEVNSSYFTAQSKKATISVSKIGNAIERASSPEILVQPKSCVVCMGGVALFCCEGQGTRPITYQWFKDGEPIPDSNMSELKIRNINGVRQEGTYMCLVSNEYGSKISQGAVLRISNSIDDKTIRHTFTATDKVALLIGNYEYRSEKKLNAPKADIQVLSEIFCNLNFKVVSLLNLTLAEMKNAVDEFCELLGPGVYAVFYFCGHGFEEMKCYLVPSDAQTGYDTRHCLCVDYVQTKMQQKKPQVSCLILDVCRTENKVVSPEQSHMTNKYAGSYNNTVLCYATSWGHLAFETKVHGLLVQSLQKFLYMRISIEKVFTKVREDFGSQPLPDEKIQDPEIRSNLQEPGRSFCDEIVYTGHTEAFTQRQMLWEHCLEKPVDREIHAEPHDLGIVLEANFQTDFANVLTIFLTVKDPGKTDDSTIAYVGRHPNTISLMGDPRDISGDGRNKKTKNTLQDIQKIKDKLVVSIYVRYTLNNKEQLSRDTQLDLDFPLVAKLQLWKRYSDDIQHSMLPGPREPTEQEDNF